MAALLREDQALIAWLAHRHPAIMAGQARVQQAEAGIGVARLWPNPTLGASVGGMAVGPRNPHQLPWRDSLNFSLGLSQTILIGKRGPRTEAATLRRDAARESYRDVLAAAAADARDKLARVVYLATRRAVFEERLASAKSIVELQKTRLDRGDISGTDYDRLVLDASAVEREVAGASAEYETALAECATALVAPCTGAPNDLASLDAAASVPESPKDFERALALRPDIRSLRLQRAAAETDARLWRRQAIPDPTVGVSYLRDYLTFAGNQPNTIMLSLGVPLPVFDAGRRQARVSLGQASELEWQARALEQRGVQDARALVLRRQILQNKLAQLEKVAIPRSDAVLKSTEAAFQRGGASMTDLLLARREHLGTRLDLADTRYELFTIRNAFRQVLGLDAMLVEGGTK